MNTRMMSKNLITGYVIVATNFERMVRHKTKIEAPSLQVPVTSNKQHVKWFFSLLTILWKRMFPFNLE